MGRFAKLWGSIAGGVAGVIVGALVGAGLGSCTNPADVATCAVFGISTGSLTSALTVIGAAVGTYFPTNSPAKS
jgi:hypothetical protein